MLPAVSPNTPSGVNSERKAGRSPVSSVQTYSAYRSSMAWRSSAAIGGMIGSRNSTVQSLRKRPSQCKSGDAIGNPARLRETHAFEAGERIGVRLGVQATQRHPGEPET